MNMIILQVHVITLHVDTLYMHRNEFTSLQCRIMDAHLLTDKRFSFFFQWCDILWCGEVFEYELD